ncbi:MAG: hypothetical protein ACTSXL_00635 [Alphaproteobacteria bacterium]|nr:MAG: hypothetical protein B6I23_02935 [Rickettsiaceae bacterium 4572_127]
MKKILALFLIFPLVSFAQVDGNRKYLNDGTMHYIDKSSDYDVFGSVRAFSEKDKQYFATKWNPANVMPAWHDYHGHLIRADMLQSNRDLREMRLKFMHHQHDRYIDGDISQILEKVASNIIRQTCGRRSSDVLRVYDRPSAEVSRPNAFYDYEIITQGVSIREYGFRCIYSN